MQTNENLNFFLPFNEFYYLFIKRQKRALNREQIN